jgi:carboxymethylenebutenolidase
MVHEVFGIEENMRAQVLRLASAGYIVLMPDLFSRGGMRKCLNATFRALTAGTGQAFDDVEAAKQMLVARPDFTGKVGVIGFCMGGGFALQLANHGYGASAVNYGMMPKDIDAVLSGACAIIGSYGAKDKTLKGAAATMERELSARGIPHDIKEYPEANHAFMNPGPAGPKLLRPFMQKVAGFKPYPEDAADAWRRIEAFFAEHLV